MGWVAYHAGPFWDALLLAGFWPLMLLFAALGLGAAVELVRLISAEQRSSPPQDL
jgi:hypothetical protein